MSIFFIINKSSEIWKDSLSCSSIDIVALHQLPNLYSQCWQSLYLGIAWSWSRTWNRLWPRTGNQQFGGKPSRMAWEGRLTGGEYVFEIPAWSAICAEEHLFPLKRCSYSIRERLPNLDNPTNCWRIKDCSLRWWSTLAKMQRWSRTSPMKAISKEGNE